MKKYKYPDEKASFMPGNANSAHLDPSQYQKIVDALINALKDEDWSVRNAAVEALGKLRDSKAVNHLINDLWNKRQEIRREAIRVLGTNCKRCCSFFLFQLGEKDLKKNYDIYDVYPSKMRMVI